MTIQLLQGRPAVLDLVLRSDDAAHLYPPRAGLSADEVRCEIKRPGATAWVEVLLDPSVFRDAGNGAYLLGLDASALDVPGSLLVLVTGRPGVLPPVLPSLLEAEVVVPRDFHAPRPHLERTLVVGQLVGLHSRPLAGATVAATLLQPPLLLGGVAVAGDAVLAASDEDGCFELPLLTGATVDVQIAAARYRRTLVVPPPPAPGAPVRLFAIP